VIALVIPGRGAPTAVGPVDVVALLLAAVLGGLLTLMMPTLASQQFTLAARCWEVVPS
jgi:hypothetical protein